MCRIIKTNQNSAYWGKTFLLIKNFKIRKIEYFSSKSTISKTLFLNEIANKGGYWLLSSRDAQPMEPYYNEIRGL